LTPLRMDRSKEPVELSAERPSVHPPFARSFPSLGRC
jgi:hypothetical protein